MPVRTTQPGDNAIREIIDVAKYGMTFEKNVDIPLKDGGLCRGNVYRPKGEGKWPVIMTYGPYGKDVKYEEFHPASFKQIPAEQKSEFSAWETPEPTYWVSQGYVVLRIDERGIGSSPGFLDTMSDQTSSDFAECIEWAADQSWSNGKIGLLGISYYGGSQWRVAARKPKGLTCIIPWEGMTDYYRDRVRHGGILSNQFIGFWYNRQVGPMQYGNAEKVPRQWGPTVKGPPVGPECIEGSLSKEELFKLRQDQTVDNAAHRYLDEPYHSSRVYDLAAIEVPVLSVANLGGIMLHLRGNVIGYLEAGSKNKWLWLISGRHDLPFYLPHYVKLQKSFLDCWLKNEDDAGWGQGPNVKVPAISVLERKGNPGFNSNEAEATFTSRTETEWPIARTQYVKYNLHEDKTMNDKVTAEAGEISIEALGKGSVVSFSTTFDKETEIVGHPTAKVTVSAPSRADGSYPTDIDLFVTLRHLDIDGKEIFYTGTAGDPVPLCKGWLRASMRAVDTTNRKHREWLPHRNYESKDVAPLSNGEQVELWIELWPTQVIVEKGNQIVFEVATSDTQGSGIFNHNDVEDRSEGTFEGLNLIHLGPGKENWLSLPLV